MGKVIDYRLDAESLYLYASDALEAGDYLLCAQNINEGLKLSDLNAEMRAKFFELLINLYENTDNNAAKTDIVIKNAPELVTDFGRIDFKEFITAEDAFMVNDEEERTGEIYVYSQIRDAFVARDYVNAFGKLLSADLSEKYLVRLSDYICLAYEEDKSFNINDYFVPAISMLAKLDDKTKLLSVMLASGGACKDLAIDGAQVFLEDVDELSRLLALAEVYYINGETNVARDMYAKALTFSPCNEDALFHYTAILYSKGDRVEADKQFARYKVLFENTFLPIGLYEKYFESGYARIVPVYYPYLDPNFVDEVTRELVERKVEELSAQLLKEISQIISACEKEEDCLILPLLPTLFKKEKLHAVILYLIRNPAIANAIKRKLLTMLYDAGYQGRYIAYIEGKLVFSTMISSDKIENDLYKDIFRELVLDMPFWSVNMPLKCNVLKNIILKAEQLAPKVELTDARYIVYFILRNYARICKINADWEIIENSYRIDNLVVNDILAKYGITKQSLEK
ncbi:MAG TPA: hypothetical protein PKY53_03400 [Clostridia bacterium]|nr:hypothetical protein [Clostridia bacterium]